MLDTIINGDFRAVESREWAGIQEPASIPLWEKMLDATGTGPGTALLDAGCAAGGASVLALARGAAVAAVDSAASFVEIATTRLPGADVQLASVGNLPFRKERFDAVLCANVIQFVPNPSDALADLVRVTRPGGKVAVAVFGPPEEVDQTAVFAALADLLGWPRARFPEFRLSQPGMLQSLLSEAGLQDVAFTTVNTPFIYTNGRIGWRGQRTARAIQAAVETAGKDRVKAAVKTALKQFARPDGSIRMNNVMWCATGRKRTTASP